MGRCTRLKNTIFESHTRSIFCAKVQRYKGAKPKKDAPFSRVACRAASGPKGAKGAEREEFFSQEDGAEPMLCPVFFLLSLIGCLVLCLLKER
jgi:hypothetical protein